MATTSDTMIEVRSENQNSIEMENNHSYDALAVVCSDGDYHDANSAFFDHLGFHRPDEVKLPAAAKNLADDPTSASYQLTKNSVNRLIELHGQKPDFPILLIWHRKCGGYGFSDTKEQILTDMQKAKNAIADLKKPARFIISEVVDRGDDGIPHKIDYTEYTLNQSQISKQKIFTYTNGRNSSSG